MPVAPAWALMAANLICRDHSPLGGALLFIKRLKIYYTQSVPIQVSKAGALVVVRNDKLRWVGGLIKLI